MSNCAYCNGELTSRQRKFCSVTCKNLYRSVKDGVRPLPQRAKRTHCETCGTPLTGRQRQFCSRACKARSSSSYKTQKARKLRRKQALVARFGGCCQQCGYADNLAALTFHHTRDKSFLLTMSNMANRPMGALLAEAEKCALLCANCHMALHSPDMASETVTHLLAQPVEEAPPAGHCVTCGAALTGRQTRFCSSGCKNTHLQDYGRQRVRGIRRKLELVLALGGCCARCGYDRNLAALSFHHDDAALEKSFKLDLRSLANRTWDAVRAEAEKCVLLCANCHAETHNAALVMPAKQKRTSPDGVRL